MTVNKSALFIAARNEIEGITTLYDKIPINAFDEVYALDGDSTDGTIEFFKERNIKVILNVKKGEIVNKAIMLTDCENLVFFAPDGNENPDDIIIIRDKLKEGYDMVIASRFMEGSRNEEDEKLFPLRLWANRVFTFLVKLIWRGTLTDTINGFRGVKRSKALQMKLEPTGFDIEFQMTIRGLKMGHKILDIPTYEGNRIGGKSAAYSLPTGILMLKRLFKELFNKIPE
jgi:glycosyltransferase involved in cell wall biosynthesis